MKKRFFLPIGQPDYICYDHITHANAIMKAIAGEQAALILSAKNINCYYQESDPDNRFVISLFDPWCTMQKCMQRQLIDFLKETYQKTDIIRIIKKGLLFNAYVCGSCNRSHIEQTGESPSSLFRYVITGYDDIAHEFIMYGLSSQSQFEHYKIRCLDFLDAIYDTDNPKITFTLWRWQSNANLCPDLTNIAFELEDYLNSTNRRAHYTKDKVYGLLSFESLIRFFEQCAAQKESLPNSYLDKFFAHKKYMKERIVFLHSYGAISSDWISYADQVERLGDEVRRIGEKYNATKDADQIQDLKVNMFEAIEIEKRYLPLVLEELKPFKSKTEDLGKTK